MSILRLCLLGTLQAFHGDVAVDELTSAKIQGLLAYLAVESDRAHSRETLAELLWPDRPDGVARQNLRQALTRLRRAIVFEDTPSPLLIDRKFVQFSNSPAVNIDLAAYGGDFIVGLNVDSSAFDEWALLKREWLRRESLHALHVLVEYNERLGDYTAAYRYAWRRVEIDSLLEDAYQQVIRALALDGRQMRVLRP